LSNLISEIVTIIQARTTSTRFPNKVLMPLAGKPLLLRMFERVNTARLVGQIVIATTNKKEDDQIFNLCKDEKINCFRGHPTDLLDRHYRAGMKYNADAVVKIPSDCPLIDPLVIDKTIKYFIENQNKFDYVSNLHPPTYPDGNDVEIMKMDILRTAWLMAKKNFEREHTTPFIWENPDKFKIGNVTWETGLDFSMSRRWTIDYEEDYYFIKNVYDELYLKNPYFGISDILSLLQQKPELADFNKKYIGVNWYRNFMGELKTITAEQTRVL